MKEYRRAYPRFSLCGLNCGLCPRYHADGTSRCPGCGGKDFHLKHPTCAVITCSQKHEGVEYCFQCSSYPCARYQKPSPTDSFITYRHVLDDFGKAKSNGLSAYQHGLDEKVELLRFFIDECNDGKRKNFFCIAVNLLRLEDVRAIATRIRQDEFLKELPLNEKSAVVITLLQEQAKKQDITLALRK
ncbi:MAG: DUF3795 domain-containing protein [Solirubrobacterales bacterium]